MKKTFLGILMLTMLFFTVGCGNKTNEAAIFDGNSDDIIEKFKKFAEKSNFKLSEPKITTSGDTKNCTLNFGDSSDNVINLKLNDDDSVASVEIIANNDAKSIAEAGVLLSATFIGIGIDHNAMEKFLGDYQVIFKKAINNFMKDGLNNPENSASPTMNDDIKIQSADKNLNVHTQMDEKKIQFLISLEK
ncbi:MAG: hypothetical protein IKZ58_09155 [Selenomonadaceae bacterium]|nr:hypothetical protein [Selenomonadaceae bacterium]